MWSGAEHGAMDIHGITVNSSKPNLMDMRHDAMGAWNSPQVKATGERTLSAIQDMNQTRALGFYSISQENDNTTGVVSRILLFRMVGSVSRTCHLFTQSNPDTCNQRLDPGRDHIADMHAIGPTQAVVWDIPLNANFVTSRPVDGHKSKLKVSFRNSYGRLLSYLFRAPLVPLACVSFSQTAENDG